ncbi:MAG TPA: glycosyltransferase family 1 protein [Anaerolineae bacterium]|nr:glycosyltransferase family 1 protein [Anaerolineae bacterium]
MSKTAVLFIDHVTAIGGAETSLLLMLQHLGRSRWQPHLACVDGRLAQAAQTLDIPTHIIPLPRLRRSRQFSRDWHVGSSAISKLARRIDAKILHANTVRAAIYAAPAAKTARRPFLWHMRDFWLSENRPKRVWIDRWGKRLLCLAAAQVIANSQATAGHLPCAGKVTVLPNAIDVSRFDPKTDGRTLRQQYNIPQDAPVVGMVGRLRPWKGQHRFIQMAAQVNQQLPESWFLIVGGSPFGVTDGYAEEVQALAEKSGLGSRLIFTGQLDDVRPALAAMNVFVHPGDPEPFGLVNIEAMAMEKPVVAFAHGALPEIVVDGETGVLAQPDDIDDLATAVLTLLSNPEKARKMGQNGRNRVKNHFNINHYMQKLDAIYRTLL